MNKPKRKELSRKEEIRQKRRQAQIRQRLIVFLLIGGAALVILALAVGPSIRDATAPVGQINPITPEPRPMAEGRNMGDPNAPIVMEVYSDFQCSACNLFAKQVEPLVTAQYVATGQVYVIYRHFPILDRGTNESKQSASASMCAAEQDRFWDYHDMVFANVLGVNAGSFTDRRLIAFAEELDMDVDTFSACLRENRFQSEITADITAGQQLGITGTPSVFVNGTQIAPGFVPTFEQLQEAFDAVLAAQS
ncbi:MAG: thioredoxin domain-containing protein [Anaerolineales bacterium]